MSAGIMQWKVSSPGGFALACGVWVLMIVVVMASNVIRRRRRRAAGRVEP